MSSAQRRTTAVVAAVLSLGLLGVSPCSSEYEASRTCTDLSMTVTAGGPGVLVPSCPPFTDAMEVSFLERITFTSVPSDLRGAVLATRRSNTVQVSAIGSAVPGIELLRFHTEPLGRGLHSMAHDYAVHVTIVRAPPVDAGPPDSGSPDSGTDDAGTADAGSSDAGETDAGAADAGTDAGPPPPPPGTSVTVTANPLVTGTGQTTIVSAVVSGGVGPFDYEWRAYRDDGTPYDFTFSSQCAAQPSLPLLFPGSDFYVFVEISDCGDHHDETLQDGGVCNLCTGRRNGAYVRVHESDGPVAIFSVGPAAGARTAGVHFDASASVAVETPIEWSLEFFDGPIPAGFDGSIESFLQLETNSQGTGFWNTVYATPTDLMFVDVPPEAFASPGAYRMLLHVNGGFSSHMTYEYFLVP